MSAWILISVRLIKCMHSACLWIWWGLWGLLQRCRSAYSCIGTPGEVYVCMCASCRQRCRSQNLSKWPFGKICVKSYPFTMRCRSHIDPMCWRQIEGNHLESILDCKKKRFCPLQGILHDLETDWPVLSGDGPSVQIRRKIIEIFVGELVKTFGKAASPGKHS